eukprot:8142588-Alexandrium_andersonii.AAC.1
MAWVRMERARPSSYSLRPKRSQAHALTRQLQNLLQRALHGASAPLAVSIERRGPTGQAGLSEGPSGC